MYLSSTSPAGIRFLASIKQGNGLKPSARAAGIGKSIIPATKGWRCVQLGLHRDPWISVSPHFSAGRVSQFHCSSVDEYSSLSPSASRDAIAFDVGSLWEFRRQETLATESVGAAAVPRREALIKAALTSFLYRSHRISL